MPSFGRIDARILIVGLAPGLRGANRTGRPFTGDFAGDLLYATLGKMGLATGGYAAHPEDGMRLRDCRITNAVRCVPPANKPTGPEVKTCGRFLIAEINAMENLAALLCLGAISHNATLTTLGVRRADHPFAHGALHRVRFDGRDLILADSYHCSRLNTNTGRLTAGMFEQVFSDLLEAMDGRRG